MYGENVKQTHTAAFTEKLCFTSQHFTRIVLEQNKYQMPIWFIQWKWGGKRRAGAGDTSLEALHCKRLLLLIKHQT